MMRKRRWVLTLCRYIVVRAWERIARTEGTLVNFGMLTGTYSLTRLVGMENTYGTKNFLTNPGAGGN